MPLPTPQKSTVSHFYKYSSPANLGWLKDILHKHEIYLPNLTQLNDDNDGLPRLAMQSEQEMADFLCSKLSERNPNMSPEELEHEEKVIRFNVRLHGPAALHPRIVQLLDDQLKDFRIYSMAKRYDMGNLWALYADGSSLRATSRTAGSGCVSRMDRGSSLLRVRDPEQWPM